jgi:glycosyltransferase involved in cell wall biosynthesis
MKTLFYFSRSIIPSRFANAVHVMKMCNQFSFIVDNVYLYCKTFKSYSLDDVGHYYGINPLPFEIIFHEGSESSFFQSLKYTLNGIIHIFKFKPDIVLTRHNWLMPFLPFLNKSTIIIVELHAPPNNITSFFLKHHIKKNRISQLIVISNALEKLVIKKLGQVHNFINVLHDGADIFMDDSNVKFEVKRKMSVAYAGHLYKGRGIEIIIQLATHFNMLEFDIYGGDEVDINFHKKNCKHLNNITFYGFVEPRLIMHKLLFADILIAPYQTNVYLKNGMDTSGYMSPLKIFEYMSLGKAILCSKLPVLEEILIHERNALLCIPDDLNDWIYKLNMLLNDVELRNYISNNAKFDLLNKYSWASRSKNILSFLNQKKAN